MKTRFMQLGFYVGNDVIIKKFSPKSKTVLIAIMGCLFALKTTVAKQIFVEEIRV